jgi:cytoskeletal protein RodZ
MTMKIRRSILGFAVVVVLLSALLIWFVRKKPTETPLTASTEPDVSLPQSANPHPPVTAPAHTVTNAAAANVATAPTSQRPALGSKWEKGLGILSTYNDVPIDFYGKIEDQFGNPVPGAEIKGSIMVNNGQREGADHPSTTSDANGLDSSTFMQPFPVQEYRRSHSGPS